MSKVTAVLSIVFLFVATQAIAGDPRCESRKLRAWGKLRACENKERAAERLGHTPDFASCTAKFDNGLIKAGTACRHVDNGDGTVTDLDTGLMWQKTDDAGGVTDKDAGYTWSASGIAPDGSVFLEFLAELNYCSSFEGSLSLGGFAGHCDWRVPQIDELRTIHHCTLGSPCLDESVFGPSTGAPCWSGSSVTGVPASAWGLSFSDDDATGWPKLVVLHVRAVRTGL